MNAEHQAHTLVARPVAYLFERGLVALLALALVVAYSRDVDLGGPGGYLLGFVVVGLMGTVARGRDRLLAAGQTIDSLQGRVIALEHAVRHLGGGGPTEPPVAD